MKHVKTLVLGLLLTLSVSVQTTTAQFLPTDARALNSSRVPFLSGTDFSLWSAPEGNHRLKSVPLVEQVGAIGMTVSDMDASIEFYSKVLSFEKVSDVELSGEDYERLEGVFGLRMRVAKMRLGDEFIELTEYLAPKGRPVPVDSRSNDRWFQHIAIITSDMDKAYTLLRQNKVEHASTGPQRLPDWNKNAGGIKAFYFRDPDKHWLEILQFPEGKGDAKWQRKDRLFLGIDHTAIVVGNTDASLKFYRDVLGLRIAGTSENYGTEQEHLNNVFGARLRITSLRAGNGVRASNFSSTLRRETAGRRRAMSGPAIYFIGRLRWSLTPPTCLRKTCWLGIFVLSRQAWWQSPMGAWDFRKAFLRAILMGM
jgi:catechol 2,3-dioxygenase-like lactoylglutathione lyase family enzyme